MALIDSVRASGIFEEVLDRTPRVRRNNVRYATDPEYRERILNRARRWNAENKAKKAENDRKWRKINGPAASKRHRARKKASACQ